MADEQLFCVSLEDSGEDFDLGAEFLSSLEFQFSSWEDKEVRALRHTLYFGTMAEADAAEAQIRELLPQWQGYGVRLGGIRRFTLKKEDWAEAWKKYFHTIEISPTLAINPSWIKYSPKPGQKVLTLDPGMSFGTGQHATTFYCLQTVDKLAGREGVRSMLDAGCGSGILSIAAKLRGYDFVEAFDFDPDAVLVAKENFQRNGFPDFEPVVGDAADYTAGGRKFDLVCANILAHLLLRFRENIASWVRPGGYLTLAGILSAEFDHVSTSYQELGFRELHRATLKEWTSGLFQMRE